MGFVAGIIFTLTVIVIIITFVVVFYAIIEESCRTDKHDKRIEALEAEVFSAEKNTTKG